MKFYRLVLGVLTVWRITHLLYAEDGPWDVIVRLRQSAGKGFWGKLLDCFYCLSLWVAMPVGIMLGSSWRERALLWPSLSAGACMLQQIKEPAPGIPRAQFTEDMMEEDNHGMLRTAKAADQPGDARPTG